jgi:hypothetical protein
VGKVALFLSFRDAYQCEPSGFVFAFPVVESMTFEVLREALRTQFEMSRGGFVYVKSHDRYAAKTTAAPLSGAATL